MWSFEQVLFVSEGSTGLESKVEGAVESVAFGESHAHRLVFPEISDTDFDLFLRKVTKFALAIETKRERG